MPRAGESDERAQWLLRVSVLPQHLRQRIFGHAWRLPQIWEGVEGTFNFLALRHVESQFLRNHRLGGFCE